MFYSLTGEIVYTDANTVAIDCNGVAFSCSTTLNTLRQIGGVGDRATLFTCLNVREDAMDLFGFADKKELECFKLLTSVTGVGPKAGLSILSQLTVDKLALCIASGDTKSITAAPGVGAKIAQRIILELKNKLVADISAVDSGENIFAAQTVNSSAGDEAVKALISLGYSRSEASAAIGKLDASLSTEDLIRQALKTLI
ncbi:MAG: Holliday junction branch migration protein RuvA [Clostridiales bacterium]|nr:Holliday junction branch migration protein RuvA [Clostridiales bacterium]